MDIAHSGCTEANRIEWGLTGVQVNLEVVGPHSHVPVLVDKHPMSRPAPAKI